jgi:hypothetical protein
METYVNDEWRMRVRRALERSWSYKTSYCFNPDTHLSYGQCAPTAIVIFETFGGEILKTDNAPCRSERHFYNRIDGVRVDFTADQFNAPLAYKDIPSNVADAITETMLDQADQMRVAFARAWTEESGIPPNQ